MIRTRGRGYLCACVYHMGVVCHRACVVSMTEKRIWRNILGVCMYTVAPVVFTRAAKNYVIFISLDVQ